MFQVPAGDKEAACTFCDWEGISVSKTRKRKRSNLALPNIWRLTNFRRLIWPSTRPLDHSSIRAAKTTAWSRWIPVAKLLSTTNELAWTCFSHGSRSEKERDRTIAAKACASAVVWAISGWNSSDWVISCFCLVDNVSERDKTSATKRRGVNS